MQIWQAVTICMVLVAVFGIPHAGKPSFAPYRYSIGLLFAVWWLTLLLSDRLPSI